MAKANNKKSDTISDLKQAYKSFILEEAHRPSSAYQLAKFANVEEEKIYNEFGSLSAIEQEILNGYVNETLTALKTDKNYPEFSAREKLLGFFFGLTSHLKRDRSFLELLRQHQDAKSMMRIKAVKNVYIDFVHELLGEAYEKGEIKERPGLGRIYPELFWANYGYIMGFWFNDDSPAFERSDAAIEKSVNLLFDSLAKSALDSLFDFGKFNIQQRRWQTN